MTEPRRRLPALNSPESEFIDQWLVNLKDHLNLSSQAKIDPQHLIPVSRETLSTLLSNLETIKVPEAISPTFEPIFKLWNTLIQQQTAAGLTTKETGVLLLSLKTSLPSFLETHALPAEEPHTPLEKLNRVLDVMGLMTFALFAAEQEKLQLRQDEHIQLLQDQLNPPFKSIIGSSPAMQKMYRNIHPILDKDISVLLLGESGTGKDILANLIHRQSKRHNKPFVAINCGAIPKDLIEAELFGFEKGAFTGADRLKLGKFELADGGTLFLDEVGELPLDTQTKLLRVLQNREIERLGSTHPIPINVRIIAATNQDLKNLVDQKKFRLDLYYRLNVFPISVPPLRDRKEDILTLAKHFIRIYAKEFNIPEKTLSVDAQVYLSHRRWEGNVRELENVIQRGLILAPTSIITAAILDWNTENFEPTTPSIEIKKENHEILPLSQIEKQAILDALKITKGNILKTATALGISRNTLYTKMKHYHVENPKP